MEPAASGVDASEPLPGVRRERRRIPEDDVLDPETLYTVESEAAEHSSGVLLHAMQGFVDAGSATRLAVDHLLTELDSRIVATFDADQLVDYRSRRPTMLYDRDHYTSYREPRLQLHAVTDPTGQEFLLLTGPEPDVQWERFIEAVRQLVERFGVRTTVALHAIPMAVPHTRPVGVIGHANRAELVPPTDGWSGTVQVPGSAAALLELRLGEHGHDAIGFVAQVPHYLAETPYPDAAAVLLDRVAASTGLSLPTRALQVAAAETREAIGEQVRGSEEVSRVVRALEDQYDAYVGARGRTSLLAPEGLALPSADELGAEVEQFLADQQDDGPQQ
jgi:proteasome assembly chaperone (PAC2) family protein